MKKILIPIDFSETSMNAIKYAMNLLKYDKIEFTIMNAFANEVYENNKETNIDNFENAKDAYHKNANSTFQREVAGVFKVFQNPKHSCNYISRFGRLVDKANEIVEKDNIDMVVIGAKGKTNDKNITLGSNALKVVKHVRCPVLTVPLNYQKDIPKKILFSSDYMMPFKIRELKLVSTLSMSFGAPINFLYVSNFKESSQRQLDNKSFLENCFTDNKCVFIQISGKGLTESINKTIKNHKTDMLVMVNQRHSYFENILYNSTIEEAGLQIKIPFLILQNLHR